MKTKFDADDELPLKKTIEFPTITIVVRAVFLENNRYYPQVFLIECLYEMNMKSKNELKETDIKNHVYYHFDHITNGAKINFSNILLDKKLYGNISAYNILYKTPTGPKPLHIQLDKVNGFIVSLDHKNKHLILFNYGLFNEICDKIKCLICKKVVLQIVLTIILERSEFIHITVFLLKKY